MYCSRCFCPQVHHVNACLVPMIKVTSQACAAIMKSCQDLSKHGVCLSEFVPSSSRVCVALQLVSADSSVCLSWSFHDRVGRHRWLDIKRQQWLLLDWLLLLWRLVVEHVRTPASDVFCNDRARIVIYTLLLSKRPTRLYNKNLQLRYKSSKASRQMSRAGRR